MKLLTDGSPWEIELESWNDLMNIVDSSLKVGRPAEPAYLFRGQSDSRWTLEPSLSRIARQVALDEDAARAQERRAMLEFQAQAHQFLDVPALPKKKDDVLNWWVLMQHYGAVTRLLDWTASPYVAIYFAVLGHPEIPGAAWIIHVATVHAYMTPKYPAAEFDDDPVRQAAALLGACRDPALSVFEPWLETDRMSAQQTFFSVSPLAICDHSEHIKPTIPPEQAKSLFIKMVIPARLKTEFMLRLRHLNVTARTLFPGIDGLGRSITELIRLRTAPRPRR